MKRLTTPWKASAFAIGMGWSAIAQADPPTVDVLREDETIAALQRAYDRTGRDEDLASLARAELVAERWLDAWHHQQTFLAAHGGDASAPWRSVRDEQRQAEAHLGRVVVETDPVGVMVMVDGVAVGRSPVDVRALPGVHVLRFEEDGRWIATRRVIAVAGNTTEVTYTLPVLSHDRPPRSSTTEYMLVGAGATLLAVSAVGAGLMASNPGSGLRDGTCIDTCSDAGTAMLSLGILIGMPLVTLGVLGLWQGADPPRRRPSRLGVASAPGSLGLGVSYAF